MTVYNGRCEQIPDKSNYFHYFNMHVAMGTQQRPVSIHKNAETGDHVFKENKLGNFDTGAYNTLFENDNKRYLQPLEIGQYVASPKHRQQVHIKPSVHIGVCPVPQLTTTNSGLVTDNITDVECTWDIDVEMVCEFGMPFSYTHYDAPHIETEQSLE